MKKFLANAGLAVFSVLLCVAMAEVCIRLLYAHLATYNTEMWRYFAEMKELLPNERLPFDHFPNREGDYYGVHIKINGMGFRDLHRSSEKPAGTCRIVMLGDSLTLGWGVPFDSTFAQALERRLNADEGSFEVINMGVGNCNSIMEVELFKRDGLVLQPDIVVLSYFVNDAEPIPRISRIGYAIKRHSYLLALLYDRYVTLRPRWNAHFDWRTYYESLYAPDSQSLRENAQAILELGQLCRDRGIKPIFVSYPELHELAPYPFPMATEHIRRLAAECGATFLDLLPHFAHEDPRSLWVSPEDTHGNAKANAIIAQALYDVLSTELPNNGLMKRSPASEKQE